MRKYIVPFLTIVLVALSINVYALQKQSAAAPGEVLGSDGDETTAVQMAGLFAVEVTSTGVGTIQIKRSEDNSTNWIVVKTLTNSAAGDQRKYLYEYFGDEDSSKGAYYKAYMSGDPTSGSFRVRLVK
jgi:hypothetical protein